MGVIDWVSDKYNEGKKVVGKAYEGAKKVVGKVQEGVEGTWAGAKKVLGKVEQGVRSIPIVGGEIADTAKDVWEETGGALMDKAERLYGKGKRRVGQVLRRTEQVGGMVQQGEKFVKDVVGVGQKVAGVSKKTLEFQAKGQNAPNPIKNVSGIIQQNDMRGKVLRSVAPVKYQPIMSGKLQIDPVAMGQRQRAIGQLSNVYSKNLLKSTHPKDLHPAHSNVRMGTYSTKRIM